MLRNASSNALRASKTQIAAFKIVQHIQVRFGSTRYKVMSAEDAAHLIRSGDTVTVGGFVAQNSAEEILQALGKRYLETKEPRDLTLIFGVGPGDRQDKGINHFAHEGMIKRVIGSHYAPAPKLSALAQANKIEAYNLPLGSISRMIRCASAKQMGHITSVGYGTLVDPKLGGGKINAITKEDLVEEIEILGKKCLIYKAVPINVAIIRGTTADPAGNITFERESLYADNLIQAMAARATGGIVLCQVERVATSNSLNPRKVKIPGTLVDGIVVAEPQNHHMSYSTPYNPALIGEVKAPTKMTEMPMGERKIIARRALLEVVPNQVVNLGIGMAEGVAMVAEEEKVLDFFTLTTEPGVHGGIGASGEDFGPATNFDALLEMNQQFDFYNGGGLGVCFLGMAQVNWRGDVNVTRVGPSLKGPGGFIDISQSTKRINLLGTFTTRGLEVEVKDQKLVIKKEGSIAKFVKHIPEVAFSGANAVERHQLVHYITERCVFTLTPKGLELTEVAPGIDFKRQILDLMEFPPIVKNPRPMDVRVFTEGRMKLLETLSAVDMPSRLHYIMAAKTLYIDLHGVSVTTRETMRDIISAIEAFFKNHPQIIKKASVFVNYDGFDCRHELIDDFSALIRGLQEKYYGPQVRRLSSAAFSRHKFADSMAMRLADSYTYDEVYALLNSRGMPVNRDFVANLCARWDAEHKEVITSAQMQSILDTLTA